MKNRLFKLNLRNIFLSLPRGIKRLLVLIFDILICALTIWVSFGIHDDIIGQFSSNQIFVLYISVSIFAPIFFFFGFYLEVFRYIGSKALSLMMRAFIVYWALFFIIFTAIGINGVFKSVGLIQPVLFFIFICGSRYFIRQWLNSDNGVLSFRDKKKTQVLIYGAGSAGRQLLAALSVNRSFAVRAFIDDQKALHGNTINGVGVYPSIEIHTLIKRFSIKDVILAIPSATQAQRNLIIHNLGGCGARVQTLPGLIDQHSGRIRVSDLREFDIGDLLGREIVLPDNKLLEKNIRQKVVLVTGAGGSIGSELCRQIIKFEPISLIIIDNNEYALYTIDSELKKLTFDPSESNVKVNSQYVPVRIFTHLATVCDENSIYTIMHKYRPHTVFHAAAYKHVPLVEQNISEGLKNNVLGTLICAKESIKCGVSNFILISTDKAVRPTNMMGASKRISELILQALSRIENEPCHTIFSMVRFGNVLGSSGSVVPKFNAQLKLGGPITLTHQDVTRYFMTIPEAAQLVIQASAMAKGGEVFVLDMGEPVRIYDLAVKMINLSGLTLKNDQNPYGDVSIEIVGLRPGEKLYEELLIGANAVMTNHPKIIKAQELFLIWEELERHLNSLEQALSENDSEFIDLIVKKLVPEYKPELT